MSNKKLKAEQFLRNNTIRITDQEQREIGNLLNSYYYKNGSVEEFECAGMTVRIKQRSILPDKIFGHRLKGGSTLNKIWLFCDGKKLMTLRVFNFYGVIHQSIHINNDFEYFDELMFYMKLSLG